MTELLQTLVTTIALGSLYALIALGYTMVYGVLKFINFSHSDIVVLGAWTSLVFAGWFAVGEGAGAAAPWWTGGIVLAMAMLTCGVLGFTIERLAYKPLRKAPRLNVLITAIGISLLLQNSGQSLIFGPRPKPMPPLITNRPLATIALPDWDVNLAWYWLLLIVAAITAPFMVAKARWAARIPKWAYVAGPATVIAGVLLLNTTDGGGQRQDVKILWVDIAIVLTAILLMVALQFLVYGTKLGQAMRAVSFNIPNAALMGINVNFVISFTFVLGSMLGAAGGFLYAIKYPLVSQTADAGWVLLGLTAFVAAVVGGIGSIRGAMLGGFLISAVQQFGIWGVKQMGYDNAPALKDLYVFAVLIFVLLVKPEGLLGRPTREKV
jgi:branched-chain amino acid transport system permease protein